MALEIGTRLGPYEILAPLGAGGMGAVYRARDTRLDRAVAVKVLSEHLVQDADSRQRFEREARAISALNHPHICALYDIGQQDGVDFLVMEYLEGEALTERLKKGPLLLAQSLRHATELADALDKAHRQGIIHRDLKPGNIVLTRSGAKLLDFGLAKLVQPIAGVSTTSALPTREKPLTEQGMVLGTLQYMSPEQLEGREADARTDIFALGSVLYEMATGKRAFEGKSRASLISAILRDEPVPISGVQPLTPPALDHLVKKCLAKDPDQRWQSAGDLADELRWAASSSVPGSTAPRRLRPTLSSAALLMGILAIGTIAGRWIRTSPVAPMSELHAAINFPQKARLWGDNRTTIALSPDGSQLVYVGGTSNERQLYLRRLDAYEVKPLQGTMGADTPFFAPDGNWVGFFAEGKLKKVALSGGPPVVLCDAPSGRGASWGDDGRIVFAPSAVSPLFVVSAGGGAAEALTKLAVASGEYSHRYPHVLPGSAAVLFTNGAGHDKAVVLQSLKTGERRTLIASGSSPHYVQSGHLVFARGTTLYAVPFQLSRLGLTGTPVPVMESVETHWNGVGAQFDVAADGTLAYIPYEVPQERLVWVDFHGSVEPLAAPVRNYYTIRVSPAGDRVVASISDGSDEDLWSYEFSRGILTRLTFSGHASHPAWATDGRWIAFESDSPGSSPGIFRVPAGGGPEERLATSAGGAMYPSSWSPDGKLLLVHTVQNLTDWDILAIHLEGDRRTRAVVQTPFAESNAVFSPDGRRIAYESDESGRREVFIQPFPGGGDRLQVSNEGGGRPCWSPDGRELYWKVGDSFMAADVAAQTTLSVSKPRLLLRASSLADSDSYTLSADGRRFLVVAPDPRWVEPEYVNVVQGWLGEVKRRVPSPRR
jgi:serine/threonine-protein kinase